MADIAQLQKMKPARPVTSFDTKHKGHSWWRPQTALAKYIWHAAKLFQIIDEAADGRLIEHHLFASAPLHMRRTLEQYYYWTASDTSRRDSDQVVCRATRSLQEDGEAIARVVMVDQLWLWILDESEYPGTSSSPPTLTDKTVQIPSSLPSLADGVVTSQIPLQSIVASGIGWGPWAKIKFVQSTISPSSSLTNAPRSSLIAQSPSTSGPRLSTFSARPSPRL
jgi:hypothetical protein